MEKLILTKDKVDLLKFINQKGPVTYNYIEKNTRNETFHLLMFALLELESYGHITSKQVKVSSERMDKIYAITDQGKEFLTKTF